MSPITEFDYCDRYINSKLLNKIFLVFLRLYTLSCANINVLVISTLENYTIHNNNKLKIRFSYRRRIELDTSRSEQP